MRKIRCPACDARLKLPDSFRNDTIKCPKCGVTFPASESANASDQAIADPLDSTFDFDVSDEKQPPQQPSTSVEPSAAAAIEAPPLAAPVNETQATTLPSVTPSSKTTLNFGFKSYWTPWIIKFSWFVVLVFSVLWIAFLTVGFVGSLMGGEKTSLLDSFGLSDFNMSSLDLEGALSGKADVDSLNKFLDGVEGGLGGGSKGKVKPKSVFQSFMTFGFSTLSFLTMVVSLILSVLFCRVFFESIMLLFDMSKTLKSIDEKSGD